MKRIVICLVLIIGAVSASAYAYFRVENLRNSLNLRIDALVDVIHEKKEEEIIEQSLSLVEYWNSEEKILIHFVRHSHIDLISISMSRLPALSKFGEYAEVYAELLSIRRQIEDIRSAELLTFGNLF